MVLVQKLGRLDAAKEAYRKAESLAPESGWADRAQKQLERLETRHEDSTAAPLPKADDSAKPPAKGEGGAIKKAKPAPAKAPEAGPGGAQ